MRALPYSNTGAEIALYVPLGFFYLLELRLRIRSRRGREGSRSDRFSFALVYITVAGGLTAAFSLAAWDGGAIRGDRWLVLVLGVALVVIGIALRQWAVAVLGGLFTVDVRVHPGQQVVDSGPYRWVRHPSYTGLLLTLVGVGLALGSWAAVAAVVVLPTVGLVVRIRVEERTLMNALGEPYRRFAATRARLLPGIW